MVLIFTLFPGLLLPKARFELSYGIYCDRQIE
jgi:hypothetical protein